MTAFVLDASVALAWCFRDEATAATWAVLDRLGSEAAAAPSLLPLEIANVLAVAERRGRIAAAGIAEFVALLDALPVTLDGETSARALTDILGLTRAEGLTAYDAAYLECAMRLGVPLATKDAELRRAATKLGVPLLGG